MEIESEILRLKLRAISQEERMRTIETTQTAILAKLDTIHDLVTQARGGWKVLLSLGAMATGIAVFTSAVLRIIGHR
jgi:hypothetical protein